MVVTTFPTTFSRPANIKVKTVANMKLAHVRIKIWRSQETEMNNEFRIYMERYCIWCCKLYIAAMFYYRIKQAKMVLVRVAGAGACPWASRRTRRALICTRSSQLRHSKRWWIIKLFLDESNKYHLRGIIYFSVRHKYMYTHYLRMRWPRSKKEPFPSFWYTCNLVALFLLYYYYYDL